MQYTAHHRQKCGYQINKGGEIKRYGFITEIHLFMSLNELFPSIKIIVI